MSTPFDMKSILSILGVNLSLKKDQVALVISSALVLFMGVSKKPEIEIIFYPLVFIILFFPMKWILMVLEWFRDLIKKGINSLTEDLNFKKTLKDLHVREKAVITKFIVQNSPVLFFTDRAREYTFFEELSRKGILEYEIEGPSSDLEALEAALDPYTSQYKVTVKRKVFDMLVKDNGKLAKKYKYL